VVIHGIHLVWEKVYLSDADGVVRVEGVSEVHAERVVKQQESVAWERVGGEIFPERGHAPHAAHEFLVAEDKRLGTLRGMKNDPYQHTRTLILELENLAFLRERLDADTVAYLYHGLL
jgi:hypothetical protein